MYTSWNKKNVKALKESMNAHPGDEKKGFETAAKAIGCTEGAVQTAWRRISRPKVRIPKTKMGKLIHEEVIRTKMVEGMRIVTVKKIYGS